MKCHYSFIGHDEGKVRTLSRRWDPGFGPLDEKEAMNGAAIGTSSVLYITAEGDLHHAHKITQFYFETCFYLFKFKPFKGLSRDLICTLHFSLLLCTEETCKSRRDTKEDGPDKKDTKSSTSIIKLRTSRLYNERDINCTKPRFSVHFI